MVLCLAAGWPAPVRAEHQRFRTFTGRDGLSQLSVLSMVQDTAGYVWVGTESGLNRFDGRRFTVFGPKHGLSDAGILALAPAADGGLWVGTHVGLDRYHHGRFESYGAPRGLKRGLVSAIATTADGALWAATSEGLAVLRGETFEYVAGLADESVHEVVITRSGEVWAGAATGLWRGGPAGMRQLDGTRGIGYSALVEGPDGRIYAGTLGEVHVYANGRSTEQIRVGGQSRPTVYGLHVDRFGALWVGDELGLVRRDARGRLQRFGRPDRLRITNVTSVLEDADGFVWAGGFGGVARFVGHAFTVFDETDGLPAANSRPVLRTRSGALWVGTVRGIARRDGDRFTAFDAADGLASSYVLALYEDRRGRIWVGTHRGLSIQGEGDRWVRRRVAHNDGTAVNSIAEDASGRVWVAMSDHGVFRADPDGEHFVPVPIPENELDNPRLLVDSADRVWVTGSLGLSVHEDGVWRTYGVADGLAHERPYFMTEGPMGHLWFGYHDEVGFTRFDGTSFRTWSTTDGLSHGSVYSLGFDRQGALWLGTAGGVDRFHDGRFLNYGPDEGYASTESNSGGFMLDADGTVWFGTAEGLCRYDPASDAWPASSMRLGLGSVRAGTQRLTGDGAEVPYRDAALDVQLELVGYDHPRQVSLRARLVGLSERWTRLSTPAWSVPRLEPGAYRLEVQGRRANEAWSTALSRTFVVAPPWWQTWWAQLIGALLLLLVVTVTVRVRLRQAERAREMDELREANRAKSQFVANVSHEIRTPMNAILGMTDLALAEEVTPRIREYLETVQSSGRALLELLNDILDLSRVESGRLELHPAPTSLRALLDGVQRTHQLVADAKGLELSMAVAPGVPDTWLVDAGRLRQVLVNLVGNALKFTRAGSVRVEADRPGGDDDVVRFRVRDTGMGIPPEQREAVFELFTQVDGSSTREHGGTGLGLAICRQLVELMGGSIGVEDQQGAGTTFTFTVRLERADPVVPPKSDAPPRLPPSAAGLRVLVAEDNPVNQLVVQRMLERLGHEVLVVTDGEEAVDAVHRERFDVVFMDVQMPRLDGIEAARQIRASEVDETSRVPIVALTAHAMRGDRERTLAAGLDAYLTKPVSAQALEDVLAELRG